VIGKEVAEDRVFPAMDRNEGDETLLGGGERKVDGAVFVNFQVVDEEGLAEENAEIVPFAYDGAMLFPGIVENATCWVIETVSSFC
jgi:hypothetical protein